MKIYADKKYQKYLTDITDNHYKETEPNIEIFSHGIIANEHDKGFGVFDEHFEFVKSSIQSKKNRKGQYIPKINHKNIPYIDEDVIYLCHLGKNSFGHFLLEHINRAWCLVNKKYQNIKIVIVDERKVGKINGYIYVLLGLLGVKKENIILLDKTTQFRNVYVPSPAFDLSAYYTDAFAKMYDKIASNTSDKEEYKKIYVSRTAMPDDRKTYGELTIEKIFKKNGFKVIYPETLPLEEQIALIKKCKVLAGCAGTALHLALFMKRGGTVIQIKRNSILADNADTQHLINMAKGLKGVFVAGSMETVKTEHWSMTPQLIGVTEYMKQFFDENGFVYSDKDLKGFDKEVEDYKTALANRPQQKYFTQTLKKYFIKYMCCFVFFGRVPRHQFRQWLKKLLNYQG
jgi:capsular polysaccharide biosynthesis protein